MGSKLNKEELTRNLKFRLKNYSQSEKTFDKEKGITYKHSLSVGDYDLWRLARFIFSEILLFKVSDQPFEKINWWISFIFQDKYNCAIAHQKLGFRIYVTANTEKQAAEVAKEIEADLYKVVQLAKPLVELHAKEALINGEIIIENNFSHLKGPYDYFRKRFLFKKQASEKLNDKKGYSLYRNFHEQRYYEQAAYFSFFSMLEHLCVLFLAFRKVPERLNIVSFSSLKWSEKFKVVFDVKKPEFKQIYDHLIGLARYQRNPAAHGNTDTVFSFYLEGAKHKISASLRDKEVALKWFDQEVNFGTLDSFLKLLEEHPDTKNIFAFINGGFNVSFNKKNLDKNDLIATMPQNELEEYLKYLTRMYDDMANMDW